MRHDVAKNYTISHHAPLLGLGVLTFTPRRPPDKSSALDSAPVFASSKSEPLATFTATRVGRMTTSNFEPGKALWTGNILITSVALISFERNSSLIPERFSVTLPSLPGILLAIDFSL
jgi:hypothetical protein